MSCSVSDSGETSVAVRLLQRWEAVQGAPTAAAQHGSS